MTRRRVAVSLLAVLTLASCAGDDAAPVPSGTTPSSTGTAGHGAVRVEVTEVARGLDTVWALAWDPDGHLHWTERGGHITRQGEPPQTVAGVEESGEAGLMGLAIDAKGRRFVMYTGEDDNRIVRLAADGTQTVLVDGIEKGAIHDGGRLVFGADGRLYASTGDAGDQGSVRKADSRNGKVLRIDPDTGEFQRWSTGHRNIQGLCVGGSGRLYATEHGPDRGDEINVITTGFDGGWPEKVGNGIKNWTPTIAPAGCTIPTADLIPQWKGKLLFGTLKEADLRVLTLSGDGSEVTGEEILHDGRFGRIRDVQAGPDGAIYLATSNRDGRGSPRDGDDRILRLAPRG
ncbi:MAG TPA: PQQ-dependent sugar dehydrogenase [Acidimicrobiales bacterium]|nr:PQQ-dependent sugar dehydrogenase [Acidimicrobiales bacterium]